MVIKSNNPIVKLNCFVSILNFILTDCFDKRKTKDVKNRNLNRKLKGDTPSISRTVLEVLYVCIIVINKKK